MYEILNDFIFPNSPDLVPERKQIQKAHNKGWVRIQVVVFKDSRKYKTFRSIYAAEQALGISASTIRAYLDQNASLRTNGTRWKFKRIY